MNLYDGDRSCSEFNLALANICGKAGKNDLLINFIENFTYYEKNLEKINSGLGKMIKIASAGHINVDLKGGYSLDSFHDLGILDKRLIIRQRNNEITDILIQPKRMIVHIDNNITKNYITLISEKRKKPSRGLDREGFEHIEKIYSLYPDESNNLIHNVFEIYGENFPVLIHPKGSVYSLNQTAKEMILSSYLDSA